MNQDPDLLRRLLRAKDRMDAASHEAWPVARLADVSGVSEAYFARSFRQAFGVPPHRYLLTRRIERAVALLRDTALPITDIAFQTGWESLGIFGRTFRGVTDESKGAHLNRVQSMALEQVAAEQRCPVGQRQGHALLCGPLGHLALAHGQVRRAVQPVHALVVHGRELRAQPTVDAPVAEATAYVRDLDDPARQLARGSVGLRCVAVAVA